MSRTYLLMLSLSIVAAACGSKPSEEPSHAGAINMEVTERGFVPANITVKTGEPVELLITRKTDLTCARQIVIDEYKVNTPLPLGRAVSVAFTPTKSGTLKYGCSMDKMISGIITVE
jgi:plastocyanin domain-containing protein